MSEILKTFADHMIAHHPTWWVILDCGHWYHWTGKAAPKSEGEFPCPECAPPITVVPSRDPAHEEG
jgi:hypothetical protein